MLLQEAVEVNEFRRSLFSEQQVLQVLVQLVTGYFYFPACFGLSLALALALLADLDSGQVSKTQWTRGGCQLAGLARRQPGHGGILAFLGRVER